MPVLKKSKVSIPSCFRTRDDLKNLPGVEWLVEGYLQKATVAMVYGGSGVGKSHFLIDLACTLSTGEDWLGHEVEDTGYVVYVCAEGEENLDARVQAWENEHDSTVKRVVWHDPLNLADEADVSGFIANVQKLPNVVAVIWSPYYLLTGATDEISAKEVKPVWININRVRTETGALQIVEHHSGEGSDRPRGSTIMENILTTEIQLKKSGDQIQVICKKQRNRAKFDTFAVALCGPKDGTAVLRVMKDIPANHVVTPSETKLRNYDKVAAVVAQFETFTLSQIEKATGLKGMGTYRELTKLKTEGHISQDARTKTYTNNRYQKPVEATEPATPKLTKRPALKKAVKPVQRAREAKEGNPRRSQ